MLNQEIQKIVQQLIQHYQPEKIILFGSAAFGKTSRWSDIDLVAIKKTNKRFYERIGEVSALIPHSVPVDILVYTPEEFRQMTVDNYFIKNEVIRKGKVVYEQSS